MFSFHKPKIYRSNLGCCICKAKSSSSRFTDSKKYENEFERCFRIQEKRTGEICNACVLLVKRWKKLSPDNRLTKHWHHVVDARAGPGTKLSGNRRIISNNTSHHHQQDTSNNDPSSSSVSGSSQSRSQKSSSQACKSDVLPLSSNQANKQSSSSSGNGGTRGRTSSLSKARAIDTNVSTFTFGEPPSTYRRNYMTSEPSSNYPSYSSPSSSSSPLTKPQSALNSSAFESVIKRFRQRQQQQHMEAQRRLLNRHERQRLRHLNNSQSPADCAKESAAASNNIGDLQTQTTTTLPKSDNATTSGRQEDYKPNDDSNNAISPPAKHVKRLSESYGPHGSLDALKVSSVLDSSIWRKEKICCGIIFRGLYNEVAIFPKLLRPCECRLRKNNRDIDAKDGAVDGPRSDSQDEMDEAQNDKDLLKKSVSPPPRATKSGSISSCTSSTSGTGSMEPTRDEMDRLKRAKDDPNPAVVRPRSVPTKKRRQQKDDAESTSTSGASISSSGGGGKEQSNADSPNESDHSSSRLILMADECDIVDDDDDAEDEELMMADDDACESSNDASSSGESLIEMDTKKSSAVA